ncbi:hypothetical protein [Streptomyces sp. NPDC047718]|uniref:hypothetical protein n=1 Tax=Streptomyces sp. NPDC047718 TaxID=3155479 RepID=UPI0033C349CC
MHEPVNRTILLFDIERFSRRDDVVQVVLRRSLNKIVDLALEAAGVEATQQYREDRGDGLIALISADVAKTVLLRSLLTSIPDLLHEHNLLASDSAQMRLRIVLATGEVAHDPHAGTTGGLVGHDLNQACRLLDADVLRAALAARQEEHCVLAVSAPVYEGVIRHGHRGVRPDLFQAVEVVVKDGVLPAWIHRGTAPDRMSAPAVVPAASPDSACGGVPAPESAEAPAPSPAGSGAVGEAATSAPQQRSTGAVFHFHGAPVIHGSFVGGDQHGVSGGHVTGDVVLGGTRNQDGSQGGGRS